MNDIPRCPICLADALFGCCGHSSAEMIAAKREKHRFAPTQVDESLCKCGEGKDSSSHLGVQQEEGE